MPRGGKQPPKKPAPVSGPGRFAKRTDQAPNTPGLEDPNMQYGDVSKLRDAQKVAPLPQASDLQASGPPPTGLLQQGGLPPFLTQGVSARPAEPGTTGLSTGAGPGPEALTGAQAPDPREQTLTMIWQLFGNEDALKMLTQLRDERSAAAQQPAVPGPGAAPVGAPGAPGALAQDISLPEVGAPVAP